jgi:hypothetical protein
MSAWREVVDALGAEALAGEVVETHDPGPELPMPGSRIPRPDWQHFRFRIIDALIALDRSRFLYISRDWIMGRCPLCGRGALAVRWHGTTPRADLYCSNDCAERDIAEALARSRR